MLHRFAVSAIQNETLVFADEPHDQFLFVLVAVLEHLEIHGLNRDLHGFTLKVFLFQKRSKSCLIARGHHSLSFSAFMCRVFALTARISKSSNCRIASA